MKKVFIFIASLCVVASCAKNELELNGNGNRTVEVSASGEGHSQNDSETKAVIAAGSGLFKWDQNDIIGISCVNGGGETTFIPFQNTSGNSFSGQISATDVLGKVAVFPMSAIKSLTGNTLTLTLPDTYTYSTRPALYMVACQPDNTKYTLTHTVGMLRFNFAGVPASAKSLEFTTNVKISGDFNIDVTNQTGSPRQVVITTQASTTENKITVTDLPSSGYFVIDIPIPVGTISGFDIALKDAEGNDVPGYVRTTAKPFQISRKKMLLIPVIGFTPTPIPDNHPFKRLSEFNVGTTAQSFTASKDTDKSGYFTWAEAQTACPDGYHLPSKAEFNTFYPDQSNYVAFSNKLGYKVIDGIAYRYEQRGSFGSSSDLSVCIIITARNLGANNISITEINKNENFWREVGNTYDVIKYFPVCGRIVNNGLIDRGTRAVYHSSTEISGTNSWMTNTWTSDAFMTSNLKTIKGTVRCIQD